MVDVTGKAGGPDCHCGGWVALGGEIAVRLAAGESHKGDVLKIAETAGIMAVKRTPGSFRCATESASRVDLKCGFSKRRAGFTSFRGGRKRTGWNEALTGVSVAALTGYDMQSI